MPPDVPSSRSSKLNGVGPAHANALIPQRRLVDVRQDFESCSRAKSSSLVVQLVRCVLGSFEDALLALASKDVRDGVWAIGVHHAKQSVTLVVSLRPLRFHRIFFGFRVSPSLTKMEPAHPKKILAPDPCGALEPSCSPWLCWWLPPRPALIKMPSTFCAAGATKLWVACSGLAQHLVS